MPKRISDEQRIVEFFSSEGAQRVQTMFNVVQGIIRSRKDITWPRKPKTKQAASNSTNPRGEQPQPYKMETK